MTALPGLGEFSPPSYSGRNIHYGVREHAMGAIANGMAYHGGVRSYTATFFVFSDYERPAIRLAAMSKLPVIFVFTHDSIGVGEDGPTHQPIEHLAALRAIPNLWVMRPADGNETAQCYRLAMRRNDGPVAVVLTRQKVPTLDRSKLAPASGVARGAYVLSEAAGGPPQVVLMATGSEVAIALAAQDKLQSQGIRARVLSVPSWELFLEQPAEYRDSVLPPEITARVSIEAGTTQGWHRFVGERGIALGLDRFGASGPGSVLIKQFGLTADNMVRAATSLLKA
jgi:transketolase